MDKGDKLLTAFQKEFGIEYAKNGFVNLPAMIKDTNIVSMIDELETNASYTSYYSLPQINAKGHSTDYLLRCEARLQQRYLSGVTM